MTTTYRKFYTAIMFLLIAMTAQANATYCNTSQYGNMNCNTYCAPPCCAEIYVMGELLFLRPELCGLEAAFGSTTIATSVAGGIITTSVIEEDEEPHSNLSMGFRIGAGVSTPCFDLDTNWMHYKGGASFHDGAQEGSWSITYDTADLVIGKRFSVMRCFELRPFFGVRAAWIQQSLHSHLETLFTAIIGDNIVFTDIDGHETLSGAGPLIGLEGNWDIGCNLSIYGSVDVVTYYGHAHNTSFNVDTFTSTVSVCDGHQHRCFNSIATDAAIGILWDKCFCCGCYEGNLLFKLGLEQHRIYSFGNFGGEGLLCLEGGVIGVGVGVCY